MFTTVLLMFTLTTLLYGVCLWFAARRIARHLQGNGEGVKAVTDHVLVPLLGRKAAPTSTVQKTKGSLV